MPIDDMLDSLGSTARALHERGFELLVAVRVVGPYPRKIETIKAIRSLTDFGLMEAVQAVEHDGIILHGLMPAHAELVRERLAAAGSNSTLSLARAHAYAFRPEHPDRGAQACERLTVVGNALELAWGQLGAWGPGQELPVDDAGLLSAIDEQLSSWVAAGWCVVGSELEVLRRVSARDENLEARIRAAEGEALVHEATVYGDWLLAEGDARGQVAEHAVHVFGPVWPLLELGCIQLEWVGPMITKVELSGESVTEFERMTLVERVLALPVCACLRTLALRHHFSEDPALCELISRASCASSLRSLSITHAARASFVNAAFERLESLELAGSELGFTAVSVPALRRLALGFPNPSRALRDCLLGLDAPALEHLEIGLHVSSSWSETPERQLADMLQLPVFERLRTLTLRSLGGLPYYGGLAQVLARIPARTTLEYIDLRRASLAPEARAELEAARSSLPNLLLD